MDERARYVWLFNTYTKRMRIFYAYDAAEPYSCQPIQEISTNGNAMQTTSTVCYCVSLHYDIWEWYRKKIVHIEFSSQLKNIFWFGDFYFIKITTYCVEKWICLFFFSRYGRQLLWFYTWFHSNQLTDDWLKIIIIYIYSLRFPAKNYLLISSSIATIWCNIGQVHMKYSMIII